MSCILLEHQAGDIMCNAVLSSPDLSPIRLTEWQDRRYASTVDKAHKIHRSRYSMSSAHVTCMFGHLQYRITVASRSLNPRINNPIQIKRGLVTSRRWH